MIPDSLMMYFVLPALSCASFATLARVRGIGSLHRWFAVTVFIGADLALFFALALARPAVGLVLALLALLTTVCWIVYAVVDARTWG